MKYSQGRQYTFPTRLFSSAKPYVRAISAQYLSSDVRRKCAHKAYTLLSKDIFALFKPKHEGAKLTVEPNKNNGFASYESNSSVSYLPERNIRASSERNEVTSNSSNVNERELPRLPSEYCRPLEVIKLARSISIESATDLEIDTNEPTYCDSNAGISAFKLEQILIFLFKDSYLRQQSVQKRIKVNLDANQDSFFITVSDDGNGFADIISTRLLEAKDHFNKVPTLVSFEQHLVTNFVNILQMIMNVGGDLEIKSANNFYNAIFITLPRIFIKDLVPCDAVQNNILQFKRINEASVNQSNPLQIIKDIDIVEPYADFVQKFQQVLTDNYNQPSFKRSVAAELMSMSEKTLSRRLAYHYGSNFNFVIKQYRLKKAYVQISEGHSVSTIAYSVGYNSASYFSHCFKEYFGFPPSQLTSKKPE